MPADARILCEKLIETIVVNEDGTILLTPAFPEIARAIVAVTEPRMREQLRGDITKLHDMLRDEGAKECALKLGRLAAQLRPKGVGALGQSPTLGGNLNVVGKARERIATFRKGLRPLAPAGVSAKHPPKK